MTRLAFATLVAMGFGAPAVAQQTPAPPNHASYQGFKEADQNGDGRINRGEAAVIHGLNFDLADSNGDRVLTRQELAAAMTGATSDEPFAAAAEASLVPFEQADKNQDGIVDAEEARDIDGFNFAAADSDADRALTRAEYRTAMVELGQRG